MQNLNKFIKSKKLTSFYILSEVNALALILIPVTSNISTFVLDKYIKKFYKR